MCAMAERIQHAGVLVEHLSIGVSGLERGLAGLERLAGRLVHLRKPGIDAPDHESAHEAGVVMPVDARELQRELVVGAEIAPAALVSAEERVGPRADHVLVGGVIAAAAIDRAVHGSEDIALGRAGLREAARFLERCIAQLGRAADIGELGRALHEAEPAHQLGGVGERAEALERRGEPLPVARGEAVGLPLDAEPLSLAAVRRQDLAQLLRGPRVGCVHPDADVLDDRGVLCLQQVGRAGEQGQSAIGAEIEALEIDIAEGVVAREVVHALLPEHQETIELRLRHGCNRAPPARGKLLS